MAMGLPDGFYFGLTASQLKTLRGLKGDPRRRQFIDELKRSHEKRWLLRVGDAWSFLQHLFDPKNYPAMPADHYLCRGRSFHKGQLTRIVLLAADHLSALAEILVGLDESGFRSQFFGMNEEQFRFSFVPFWVAQEWQREGRATVLTEEQFNRVWSALKKLRLFLKAASEADRHVVFACDFKAGPS
jgi:hypothetical protein